MQNEIPKFRKISVFSETPKKWKVKNLDKLQLLWSLIFFIENLHTLSTQQRLLKDVRDFFGFV